MTGDKALVAEVAPVLTERGLDAESDCPAVTIRLERRGQMIVVSTTDGREEGTPGRAATDVRTAATVIESWARTDVAEPLLARRSVDDDERPDGTPGLVTAAPAPPHHRLQLFTAAETGFASDRTSYLGVEVGACVILGPVCVGALARLSTLTDGPGAWAQELDRETADALVGAEWPVRLGPVVMTPGVAFGIGWIHTHEESGPEAMTSLGGRAESHLALALPLTESVSAEMRFSVELARAGDVDTTSPERFPSDPRLLGHLGAGFRFGGL